MLGLIRFVLAFAVLLSHIPGISWALNPGVIAVVCFYCISGYLMRRSYERFLRLSAAPARVFLQDRLLKLYPQYLLALLLTAVLLWHWGPSQGFWVLNQQVSLPKLLLNAVLLPTNYIFGPFVITGLLPHPLVPPAWSLATEFHFYLLLPLLFRWPRVLALLLVTTLALQIACFFHESTVFGTDALGYRYIFGMLPVFLMGFFLAAPGTRERGMALGLWLIYCSLALADLAGGVIDQQRAHEVLAGAVVALPLLALALRGLRLPWPPVLKAWDDRLGNLAYPVFITHCLSIYTVEQTTGMQVVATPAFVACTAALCVILAVLLERVQRVVERYRFSLRGFASMKDGTPAQG